MTLEEKIEKVRNFRPIDDVFFEVLASDPEVCQEILRVILEDPGLVVEDVVVQRSLRNLYGHSVRLDAMCRLGNGIICNVEVQRADDDDHLRRARYNGSIITVRESEKAGDAFKYRDVKDVIVVFISEKDFLKGGKTIYHVDKVLRETGTVIDDGFSEVFVNAQIDDGTDIAELMGCFLKKEVDNKKFEKFSSRVRYLREDEGGVESLSAVMKRYEDQVRSEDIRKTVALLKRLNISNPAIADGIGDEFNLSEEDAWKYVHGGIIFTEEMPGPGM